MSPRAALRLETLGFTDVYDYPAGKVDWSAFALPTVRSSGPTAADAMRRDAPAARWGEKVAAALERLGAGGWTRCPVVNEDGIVLGRLQREKLEEADRDAAVETVMIEGPATYRPDVSCQEMVDAMKSGGFDLAFITDPDGRWLGLLSRPAAEDALGV